MRPTLEKLRQRLPAIGSLHGYLAAAAILALALAVRLPLDYTFNQRLPPFLTVYPAVVLSSFIGGARVGGAAALFGGLIAWRLWAFPDGGWTPTFLSIFAVSAYVMAMSLTVATCSVGRWLLDDVSAHEAERSKQARETVHRIRNLIAVVQAMAFKMSRDSVTQEDFRRDFAGRMAGLGTAQEVLVRTDWHDAELSEIVGSALAPFLPNPALHIAGGPAVNVRAEHVAGLCLALYELATNSMKHGALFSHPGQVSISWSLEDGQATLTWSEKSGLTETPAPQSTGFGSSLIRAALNNATGTRVQYDVADTRVLAVFAWPL